MDWIELDSFGLKEKKEILLEKDGKKLLLLLLVLLYARALAHQIVTICENRTKAF